MSVQVRYDADTFAVIDAVLALRLDASAREAEWAKRLGVPRLLTDHVRKAYHRAGRPFGVRVAAPVAQVEPEPPTQRSERVPAVAVEPPCRAFVAPAVPAPVQVSEADGERVLVIPDVHIPCHDQAATDLAIAIGMRYRPTTIVVLGDMVDFAPLSFHQRSRKVHGMREERDGGRAFRAGLDQIGARRKIFCAGNHEFRLDRYMHSHASALSDLDELSLDSLLQLTSNGWSMIPYHEGIRVGGIYYTHEVGHCGMHAVRTSGERMATGVFIGHVHSVTGVEMHSIDGEPRPSYSTGWLGRMSDIDYRHRAKAAREWPHAVSIVDSDGKNDWVTPIVMRDRSRVAMLHGQTVRAA